MRYTYLLLLLVSILFPLLFSFDKRINFYKRWPSLFISITCVALFFILWDEWFTQQGVWSFNREYLTGIFIFSLPMEECMFFVFIPYACVFIYDSLNYFIKKDLLQPFSKIITFTLITFLLVLSIYFYDRIYTSITFALGGIMLAIHHYIFGTKYSGRFYIAYLVHLIPFFIVNGILTSFPVVLYNDQENLAVRMGTIPIEDSIYSMVLLLMNITLYEWLNEKRQSKKELFTSDLRS